METVIDETANSIPRVIAEHTSGEMCVFGPRILVIAVGDVHLNPLSHSLLRHLRRAGAIEKVSLTV
jgi:hypothetical protein